MLRKTVTALAVAAIAFASYGCGEDRSGDVKFEGDTGTTTTGTTGTTETTGTIPTTGTETTP